MKSPRFREFTGGVKQRAAAILLCSCVLLAALVGTALRGAEEPPANPAPLVAKYCVQCHAGATPMGGVDLKDLTAQASVGQSFATWEKVAGVLEQHRMPPKGMPQPTEAERQQAVAWIRAELAGYVKKHDGDPGRVTVRRLTSGEYAYAIHDLTGIDLDVGIDASSDRSAAKASPTSATCSSCRMPTWSGTSRPPRRWPTTP